MEFELPEQQTGPAENKKNAFLINGGKYKLWKDGLYIGIAMWSEVHVIGGAFVVQISDTEYAVAIADEWESAE
jgi:hypothetical protein